MLLLRLSERRDGLTCGLTFAAGSARKSSTPGFKTGPRTKALVRPPALIPGNSSLHSDLLREFHDSGIYEYAEDLGIIRNGELSLPNSGLAGEPRFAAKSREIVILGCSRVLICMYGSQPDGKHPISSESAWLRGDYRSPRIGRF